MLLTDNRIKVNTQDMDGWTALMWACEYKFVDVVKSLLEKGADPHLRDRVCDKHIVTVKPRFTGPLGKGVQARYIGRPGNRIVKYTYPVIRRKGKAPVNRGTRYIGAR